MLQNASQTKQNKMTAKKRKKVPPGRSPTRDLRRVRATHHPLQHANIAKVVRQIGCISHFCAHEIDYSRWRRKCRRTTKWVLQKITLEYHRNPNWVPQEYQDYVLRSPKLYSEIESELLLFFRKVAVFTLKGRLHVGLKITSLCQH